MEFLQTVGISLKSSHEIGDIPMVVNLMSNYPECLRLRKVINQWVRRGQHRKLTKIVIRREKISSEKIEN